MIITQKSPKKFRFTFVGRLQNLSLSVIKRKLKHLKYAYSKNQVSFDEVRQILCSYNAHLSYGNTFNLRKSVLSTFYLIRDEV